MNPYSASILAREIYRERVRESLARAEARRRAAPTDAPTDVSRDSWASSISRTRFQTAVRWLVAELFLS